MIPGPITCARSVRDCWVWMAKQSHSLTHRDHPMCRYKVPVELGSFHFEVVSKEGSKRESLTSCCSAMRPY